MALSTLWLYLTTRTKTMKKIYHRSLITKKLKIKSNNPFFMGKENKFWTNYFISFITRKSLFWHAMVGVGKLNSE